MKTLSQFMKILQGKEGTLRERIFSMICVVGGEMAVLALLETLPIANVVIVLIALAALLAALFLCFFVITKYHAVSVASVIIWFVSSFIILPEMFFYSGGIEGGATIWFAVNIIFVFLIFEGKRRVLFALITILVEIVCYGVGYFYPETIHNLPSREAVFADSIFSVIVVGISIGFMLKVYISTYKQQRIMIEEQKWELEKAWENKNSFFTNMSHEIRTPINSIIGFDEMILRENEEGPTRQYAEDIKSAGNMLLGLVNDILDISQLEMKKMEILEHNYDVAEMLRDLVGMIKIQIEEKELDLQLDIDEKIPSVLIGDHKRIRQILVNLMTNAVKYTTQGTITFGMRIEAVVGEEIIIRFTVKDTGIGIRKEHLEGIYDSFKRVGEVENDVIQGSGLGLTITKQLVDLMGGEISVDSIYSKGSVFTVMIPQRIADSNPVGTMEQIFANNSDKGVHYHQSFEAPEARILIVDDNAMNIKVVKSLLSATAVQIDFALSGEECLEKTVQRYYHVILLDHKMPGMDGVETLYQIQGQENGLCRDSAIIAMTANVGGNARNYYRDMGFDDYLEKPIESSLLEQYILGYLPDDIIEYSNADGTKREESRIDIKRAKRKKKKKLIITTDCVADLSAEDIQKYGIGVMYLYIRTEKGRFADTREINSDNLPQYLTDDSTTAYADSVSLEEYEEFFVKHLDLAEDIIHISMASNAGNSFGIAKEAAKTFDHVHVIDSQQISCGQGIEVLYAARLAYNGGTVEEIISSTTEFRDNIESCFVMPTTKIFYNHGYTNKMTDSLCRLLRLHPILKMRKSRITIVGFCFGNMNSSRLKTIRKQLMFRHRVNPEIVYITHVGLNVKQQQIIQSEITKRIPFEQVYLEKASFSCAVNSGMGTFGFAYCTK